MGWFEKETGYGGNTQFSLGMSMTSCTDWLEMESYTSDDVDYIFENETKADLFVQGCYRGLYTRRCFIILVWVKR